ncbi:major capsid protein [Candidatus Parcubacteria bacterium]|nr:major capsid protein [Candidatus Parcubacteria bacterium]
MPNQYLGVDPMLTNVAIAYKNEAYIHDKIFPYLNVKKQTGKHFVYDQGRFRVNETERAAGANSKEVTLKLTVGTAYFCEDHALKEFVPDEDRDNAITPTTPLVDAAENVSDMMSVAQEKAIADWMANTANLTNNTTLSGTDQWSDFSNSDPFNDIKTAKQTVHEAIFTKPNTLILGKQVFDTLQLHPDLLERVKYSQRGVITIEILKALFDVENILIGAAGYNSATEGQTDSMSYLWGKHAWVCYIAPKVKPKMVTLGFTYRWKKVKVERMRGTNEEDRKGTYVRLGDNYFDQKSVAVTCAYLIKDAIA